MCVQSGVRHEFLPGMCVISLLLHVCFPVKTVILANVRPFRDKLIYFGCLFNPFMPEEFSKMSETFGKKYKFKKP